MPYIQTGDHLSTNIPQFLDQNLLRIVPKDRFQNRIFRISGEIGGVAELHEHLEGAKQAHYGYQEVSVEMCP